MIKARVLSRSASAAEATAAPPSLDDAPVIPAPAEGAEDAVRTLLARLDEVLGSPRRRALIARRPELAAQLGGARELLGQATDAVDEYHAVDGAPGPLACWGVVQAMVIQQTGVLRMIEALDHADVWPDESPALALVRDIQGADPAAPARAAEGELVVSHMTTTGDGPTVVSGGPDGVPVAQALDLGKLAGAQGSRISAVLAALLAHLDWEDLQHRREFRGVSLAAILEHERDPGDPDELAALGREVRSLTDELQRRDLTLDVLPEFAGPVERIGAAIAELADRMDRDDDRQERAIVAEALAEMISGLRGELRSAAAALDERYASDSPA